jgi:hypothetical protein
MRRLTLCLVLAQAFVLACDGTSPSRGHSVRATLTNPPELLEFETPSARHELYRELLRIQAAESGQVPGRPVLFPVTRGQRLLGAPALEAHADLLQAPQGEPALQLTFDESSEEKFSTARQDILQGLSEREVAELVARSLLSRWGIRAPTDVQVDRASGAPYAAAYVDGILRINPSFLYLAASVSGSSNSSPTQ